MRQLSVFACLGILLLSQCGVGPARAADPIPADPPVRWFKGNLHTHTLWSDGNDFPEMVADWYSAHGYQFLALSDHNILSEGRRWMKATDVARREKSALEKYRQRFGDSWVEIRGEGDALEVRLKPLSEFRSLVEVRGEFLMIPAEEITDSAEGKPVHLNATNVAEMIKPLGGRTVKEAFAANVRAVEEQAKRTGREIIIHLNHPNYGYAITAEELAEVVSEPFFEVFNGHPGVNQKGDKDHPSVEHLWDVANTLRLTQLVAPPLMALATDDSHDYHQQPNSSRPGRGWVMVRARHLTAESLIRALKAGDFYASTGVTLRSVQYDAQKKTLEVAIEPDGDAVFTTQFIGTPANFAAASEPRVNDKGEEIRSTRKYTSDVGKVLAEVKGATARYQLTGDELYVRAVVTSSKEHAIPSFADQKQQAWTQPVGWEGRLAEAEARLNAARPGPQDSSAAPRLVLPAYFYPAGEGLKSWDKLIDSPAARQTIVIVNPASGPGDKVDPNYAAVFARAKKAGLSLIGYVTTSYAKRPAEKARADVDRWLELYPEISGIFLDEQHSGEEQLAYYTQLCDYVKKEKKLARVVSNPGTVCSEAYFTKTPLDAICLFEGPWKADCLKLPAWTTSHAQRTLALLYALPTPQQARASLDECLERKFGYLFISNREGVNPWDDLPESFDGLSKGVAERHNGPAPKKK